MRGLDDAVKTSNPPAEAVDELAMIPTATRAKNPNNFAQLSDFEQKMAMILLFFDDFRSKEQNISLKLLN